MQQAFQKNNLGQQAKLGSAHHLGPTTYLSGTVQRQQVSTKKESNNNFVTVTANTGSMIMGSVSSQVNPKPEMPQIAGPNIKINSHGTSKSNQFSEAKRSAGGSKSNQQTHHTLQCISDINDFKHKINMVLQNQAFPGNASNQPQENASSKQISFNPTSRIVYPQGLDQPTPTRTKPTNVFTKRTPATQKLTGVKQEDLVRHEQQVEHMTTAFQSFKQNLKQNHVNPNEMQDPISNFNHPATYLLKNQRKEFQEQLKQTQQDMAAAETPIEGGTQSRKGTAKRSYLTNIIGQSGSGVSQYSQANNQQQARRKLLFEYGSDKQAADMQNGLQTETSRNSKPNQSQVFTTSDATQSAEVSNNQTDLLESLHNLNIEMLDDKERERLRSLSVQYQVYLQRYEESQSRLMASGLKSSTNDRMTESAANLTVITGEKVINSPVKGNRIDNSEAFTSEEKFKENEKNLNENRLKKESTIVIPFSIESRKIIKSNTPMQTNDVAIPSIVNNAAQTSKRQTIKVNQHITSDTQIKRNVSQNNFQVKKVSDMLLNDPEERQSIFKTEKRVTKLMQGEDTSETEPSSKVATLQSFIQTLEKPKQNMMGPRNNLQANKIGDLMEQKSGEGVGTFGHSNKVEWMQNMNPVRLFLSSLNCSKPTPQQINVMNNSKQRLDLFKILQAREHVKFTNIQSEKMMVLHTKLEEDFQSRNNGQGNLRNIESQKYLDFVMRNGLQYQARNMQILTLFQQKQMQGIHNLQELKTMQKQQQNDQKAFSIFQMNELAQFRSMSDSQQKQILLNNLQQGKFDEFECLVDPPNPTMPSKLMSQERKISNNSKLNKNLNNHSYQESDSKGSKARQHENLNASLKETKDGTSSKNIGQRRSMLVQNEERPSQNKSMYNNIVDAPAKDKEGLQSVKMLKYLNHSEQVSKRDGPPDQSLHVIRNAGSDAIQKQYEESKIQFELCLRENILKQQQIKIFYQQMNEAFGNKSYPNQIYSELMQQAGFENLFPNLPKNIIAGIQQMQDLEEKNKTKLKVRTLGISNIAKPLDKPKKPNTTQSKDTTLTAVGGGAKAKQEDDKEKAIAGEDGVVKDGDAEEPVHEVKKPRYFPPRKLPNPFENAAQEQERFLAARKEALAKYSEISKNRFKQDENQPLKYVIRPGNNSKLITRVLEKSGRIEAKYDNNGDTLFPGWEAADDHFDSLYNFKWKPTSNGIKYDLISKHGLRQLVNHVKGHYALTTKDNLFLNLKAYYESQKMNIYDIVPLTFVFDYLKEDIGDKVEIWLNVFKIIDKYINSDVSVINQKMQEMQSTKEKSVKSPYNLNQCCHNKQNLWLLKPTGFNRGIGIHIFQTFDQLREILAKFYGIGRGPTDKTSIFQTHNQNHVPREYIDQNGEKQMRNFTFVIQKLIEKPMLYLNRKFDIRMWVLFNSSDGRIYLYQECYVRTSSKEYQEYDPNVSNEEQIFMQLTNNAIQKDGEDYGKFEEGNIVSTDTLFNYIATLPQAGGKSKNELNSDFYEVATKAVNDSMKSVKGKITHQRFTFELFGYDFILDEDLNTILIEVNTNPCLEESNKLLKNLLPRMIDDLFNITMDPLFYPGEQKYRSNFPLPGGLFTVGQKEVGEQPHQGYKDTENLFKHICTLDPQ